MRANTTEIITTAIQERDPQKLASALDKVRAAATNTPPSWFNPNQESRNSANLLHNGFHRYNINARGVLTQDCNNVPELVIWGSPLPQPSNEGLVAYNIEYLGSQEQIIRRLELIDVQNNNWEIVPPLDQQDLSRYNGFRSVIRLGIFPSPHFYNQPNHGERVTPDDINEAYFLPHNNARLRIIVDHTAARLWDGEWAYHYTPALEAQPGDLPMNLKQSYERFQELGLAHVTLKDRIKIAINRPKPLKQTTSYRGLFAYRK